MPALVKQPISLNFAQGLDTKTSPYQVQMGKMLTLVNGVFNKQGDLIKRNGNIQLTTLPNTNQTTIITLKDNLIATGTNLYSFSSSLNTWFNQGLTQPVTLSTLSLIRSSTSQTSPDAAVINNLTCLVYNDSGSSYYQITDSTTGGQVIGRTALPATATNARVFILGSFFIVTFIATVAGTPDLQFIAISYKNPSIPSGVKTIAAAVNSLTTPYDGFSVNQSLLYIAWVNNSTAVNIVVMDPTLSVSLATPITTTTAPSQLTVTVDTSQTGSPILWISFWETNIVYAYAYNTNSMTLITGFPVTVDASIGSIANIISAAVNGMATIIVQLINNYSDFGSYPVPNIRADIARVYIVTQSTATAGLQTIIRSVSLASKAFIGPQDVIYFIAEYGNTTQVDPINDSNQPTYYLLDRFGNCSMHFAYSNGGGYASTQVLPSVSLNGNQFSVPYMIVDLLATVNKNTATIGTASPNAIYTQTGINMASFTISNTGQYSSEIADALYMTGGQLWEYDGTKPTEQGFNWWPENIQAEWSTTGGSIAAQPNGSTNNNAYFYQVTYEWTDNTGKLHRSAPSIPVAVTTTGSGTTGSIELFIPTLSITYKIAPNPIRIVIYRWSVAQEVYYQVTSITSPLLNTNQFSYVTYTDTMSDAEILGNTILYTTGGVLEDILAPPSIASCLFNNRLWLIDAEDQNLLWFSKQVIEAVPVETTDLLTVYVAPTTGTQGPTGFMTAISAMDDKLIIFKKDAIYYINGTGPDNTGANSQYSDPIFITSSVGCANPNSIVITPNGLMFQSDKGIWLLGRDLTTNYIGAPVEAFNGYTIFNAQTIPGTNQVRFITTDTTLMYDYFYNQWGTFTNVSAIGSTLYQSLHTYLNNYGQIFQEAPNTWIDGSNPVLMSFTTAWINIAGIQGLERFYSTNLLGTYYTPFKLQVGFSYDYNPSPLYAPIVDTNSQNFGGTWGSLPTWGAGNTWGSNNVFSARVFPEKQKCQSFQLTVNEFYDNSFNTQPGQGLTFSGLLLLVGMKRGSRTQSAAKSFG